MNNVFMNDIYSIGIEDFFFRLLDHIKVIIISALFCAVLSALYAWFFVAPEYEATAKLYVLGDSGATSGYSLIQANTALTVDYMEAFDTPEVREMVLRTVNVDCSQKQLHNMLSIHIPENTRVMHISVRYTDAQLAADIANAYAEAGCVFINDTMKISAPEIISYAVVPRQETTPGIAFYAMMGFAVGLVLVLCITGIAIIFDDKPANPDAIFQISGVPVIAVIPARKKRGRRAGCLKRKAV